jgi:hypothetical protein
MQVHGHVFSMEIVLCPYSTYPPLESMEYGWDAAAKGLSSVRERAW